MLILGVDFDVLSSVISHGIENCMRLETRDFPLMMVENAITTAEQRYKVDNICLEYSLTANALFSIQLLELFFEEFHFPATYIPSTAMLGAFCYGRSTALVIDMGASHTTISPVVDGYVLKKAVVSTSRGGDYLDSLFSDNLASKGIQVIPWFQKPGFSPHPVSVTPSFVKMHRGDVLRDIKQWMCFLSPYSKHEDDSSSSRATVNSRIQYLPSYELPDGTAVAASEELCLVPDVLFKRNRTRAPAHVFAKATSTGPNTSGTDSNRPGGIIPATLIGGLPAHAQPLDIDYSADPLHELVYASIAKCDIDCRKELLSNIVLVGGGSLLDGLPARLTSELSAMLPSHMKVCLCFSFSAYYVFYHLLFSRKSLLCSLSSKSVQIGSVDPFSVFAEHFNKCGYRKINTMNRVLLLCLQV